MLCYDQYLCQHQCSVSSECSTGRYGVNGESHCDTCFSKICNRHDGHGTYGCIDGLNGDGCHLLGIQTNIDMFEKFSIVVLTIRKVCMIRRQILINKTFNRRLKIEQH